MIQLQLKSKCCIPITYSSTLCGIPHFSWSASVSHDILDLSFFVVNEIHIVSSFVSLPLGQCFTTAERGRHFS
jgi:hypothetical protein